MCFFKLLLLEKYLQHLSHCLPKTLSFTILVTMSVKKSMMNKLKVELLQSQMRECIMETIFTFYFNSCSCLAYDTCSVTTSILPPWIVFQYYNINFSQFGTILCIIICVFPDLDQIQVLLSNLSFVVTRFVICSRRNKNYGLHPRYYNYFSKSNDLSSFKSKNNDCGVTWRPSQQLILDYT